jgi:hypothetical protein
MSGAAFSPGDERSLAGELRPPAGWEAVAAALSTYSLDLTALLAVLLALSGHARSEESASIQSTQRAILRLARRVIVLSQRGRTIAPQTRGRARVLAALDRCLAEQPFDERHRSWHGKLALASYRPVGSSGGAELWRLWIGSRNLTRSLDLDAGFMLVGRLRTPGQAPGSVVAGLGDTLAAVLVPAAERVPAMLFPTIQGIGGRRGANALRTLCHGLEREVTWDAPPGIEVVSLAASVGARWDEVTGPPPAHEPSREILFAAPFVDAPGLRRLAGWRREARRDSRAVISSAAQLADLPPEAVAETELLAIGEGPEFGITSDWPGSDEAAPAPESDLLDEGRGDRGLHAKILLSRPRGRKATLVLGSPNLTRRGLAADSPSGANLEVAARLRLSPTLADALDRALRSRAGPYTGPPQVSDAEAEQANINERLEAARKAMLAGFDAQLRIAMDNLEICAAKAPEIRHGFALEAALQSRPDVRRAWPGGQAVLRLAEELRPDEWTELVLFRLEDRGSGEAVTWAQKVPLAATGDDWRDGRDAALAARILAIDELQALIAAELASGAGDGGRPWNVAGAGGRSQVAEAKGQELYLEKLLRLRARRPEVWDTTLTKQIAAILDAAETNDALSGVDRAQLEQFRLLWGVVVDAFAPESRSAS